MNRKGASSVTAFRADQAGEFAYFCSLPGHRPAGMEGKIVVGSGKGAVAALPPSAKQHCRGPRRASRSRRAQNLQRSRWEAQRSSGCRPALPFLSGQRPVFSRVPGRTWPERTDIG